MKVLLLTEFFPNPAKPLFTGGVEARTFMIAQHLAQEMEVEVVCRRTKQLRRRIKKGGLTIYPCGPAARRTTASFFSIFGRLVFILASLRQGLRLDFDLVEGSNFISYLPAFFLGKIKKKPTVAWTADVLGLQWLTHFNLTGLFGYLLERAGLSRNWNGLIAMSGQTKKKLVKRGIREARVRVVYGGVGYQTLNQLKVKKFEKRTIICISRLVNYKRVEDLIQAFTKLQVEEDDLRLIIIGSGPEEKGLRKLVQKNNLRAKVSFLVDLERKRVLETLKRSYILCSASVVEGFGLVAIEAAACGVPYVISDLAVHREITKGGQGGLLFKRKDVNDLKAKITELLKSKKLYRQKKQAGLLLAKEYDWSLISKKTRKIYQQVVNNFPGWLN